MSNGEKLVRGTQIAYVPDHAKETGLTHRDVRFGFVTSGPAVDGSYFCRYWLTRTSPELRTKSCSELTPIENIVIIDSHTVGEVETALKAYC